MNNQFIEFEKQIRSKTMEREYNGTTSYRVTQPALLFTEGERYPDKFDYFLYDGEDINVANTIQPLPAGQYDFAHNCLGTTTSYGITRLNLDASLIVPRKSIAKAS